VYPTGELTLTASNSNVTGFSLERFIQHPSSGLVMINFSARKYYLGKYDKGLIFALSLYST
jgi:hypothetical protein